MVSGRAQMARWKDSVVECTLQRKGAAALVYVYVYLLAVKSGELACSMRRMSSPNRAEADAQNPCRTLEGCQLAQLPKTMEKAEAHEECGSQAGRERGIAAAGRVVGC